MDCVRNHRIKCPSHDSGECCLNCEEHPMDEDEQTMICPCTGTYCSGDLAHLCLDYGCARKVGESPNSAFETEL